MSARLFTRVTAVIVLLAPVTSWAAAKTCLTGTDAAVASDPGQIGGLRDLVEVTCPCANFDGTPGKAHGDYVKCASNVITAQVSVGALRTQCKAAVKKYYADSTCGLKASLGSAPCIKKTLSNGKVACSIKPAAKCVGTGMVSQMSCPNATHCLDATDTNHDLIAAAPGDNGSCVDDATTMDNKLVMGYQGWFAAAGDGSPVNCCGGWRHWANGATPNASNVTVDLWPDTSELAPDELFATAFTRPDGSPAPLYSAYKQKTVLRHFKWMKDFGLDGVMQQRFIGRINAADALAFDNQVLRNTRAGAEAYGRVFAVMYDTSGANPATFVTDLKNDWNYLTSTLHITDSPRYLRHKGKPVLVIWGLGFIEHPGTPADAAELISYFKSKGLTVMGGVPTYWRTLTNDAQPDPGWASVYRSFDVLSPWTVGRYVDEPTADAFKQNLIVPDIAEAAANGVEYMPVVFPGFSWHNLQSLRGSSYPLNQIPRNGGRFYWRQVYNAISAGSTMIFGAMFDEVDEGTAMYKVAATPADMPAQGTFVPLNIDGYSLPSDWYLRLGGEAGKMLRGDIPPSPTIPITP